MARRYVSIKEVAARAGVSFQTASKVLNGGNVRVSAETAARIIAVAESLGYRPNTVARSLVQQSTATIGLVAGDITDGALSQFAVAAERTARGHGHAVLVGNLAEGGEDGATVVQMLIDRRVDGVIAAAPQLEGDLGVAEMLRRYVPAVSLHHVPGGGVPLVGSNHRAGARTATEHLIGLGHTSIGTVTGPFRRHVVRSRLHGYEDALRTAGIEPDEDLAVEADWTPGTAAAATRLLLERDPRMTAIFVHSDTMAIGVLSALASAGRRSPRTWPWSAATTCRSPSTSRRRCRPCGCRSPRPAGRPWNCSCAASPGSPHRSPPCGCRWSSSSATRAAAALLPPPP